MEPIAAFAVSKASALGKATALSAVTRGAADAVGGGSGGSDDSSCLLCGAEGTPHHRLLVCPGSSDERNSCACDFQLMAEDTWMHTHGV